MAALLLLAASRTTSGAEPARLRFAVSYPEALAKGPLDGRLLLLLSTDASAEPRFQISDTDVAKSQQVFGVDVLGWKPGEAKVFDASVLGYPAEALGDVKAGRYRVQALLHRYETFHRADGHVVKLPMDRGEGQQWNRAPGNLLSTPREVAVDPARDETVSVELDKAIPEIPPPADTRYVKHIRIQSERLSKFWGRPMHLGAVVLLPAGFDEHPQARFPLAVFHGHFPYTMDDFREQPIIGRLKPDIELAVSQIAQGAEGGAAAGTEGIRAMRRLPAHCERRRSARPFRCSSGILSGGAQDRPGGQERHQDIDRQHRDATGARSADLRR
jgi:hypothetical protein